MVEPSVGHEDGRKCSIPVLPDVQQLDSEPLARQTLEGQRDIGKALELDAQARIVEAGSLLRISGGVSLAPYRLHLALQRAGVAGTVTLRYDGRTSELLRRPVRLRFRETFDDEVPTSSIRPVRHAAPCRYPPLAASLSAMVWRSFSIFRMSASRTRDRS